MASNTNSTSTSRTVKPKKELTPELKIRRKVKSIRRAARMAAEHHLTSGYDRQVVGQVAKDQFGEDTVQARVFIGTSAILEQANFANA